MPLDTRPNTFVARFAASLALVTISMTGAAYFLLKGAPGRPIQVWQDSAGNEVCRISSGGTLSGACTVGLGGGGGGSISIEEDNAVVVETGSVLDFLGADFNVTESPAGEANITINDGGIDHGGLAGLADDDHTQYHTDARALTWLGTRSTTDLAEGTRLYYTNERVDDQVDALIVDGTNITTSYNDGANTLTINATDTNTTYTAGQGLGLTGTSFSVNATLTGSLAEYQTLSGSRVHAQTLLTSSGSAAIDGSVFFNALNCSGNTNGGALTIGAGGQVVCSDDDSGGGSGSPEIGTAAFTGAVKIVGDPRWVNVAGDTMTGDLLINDGTNEMTISDDYIYAALGTGQIFLNSDSITLADSNENFTWLDLAQDRDNYINLRSNDFYFTASGSATPMLSLNTEFNSDNANFLDFSNSTNTPTFSLYSGDALSEAAFKDPVSGNTFAVFSADVSTMGFTMNNIGGDPVFSLYDDGVDTSLQLPFLPSCTALETDADGYVLCGSDAGAGGGISQADGDARYVNTSGDTMTGALNVRATISGSALTIPGAGPNYLLANTGIGFLGTPQTKLEVLGTISGASLSIDGSAVIEKMLTGTATLDFASTASNNCTTLTITVTGAADGDVVVLGVPNASNIARGMFDGWVSAANTVSVKFCAYGTTGDPASGSFRATVFKF